MVVVLPLPLTPMTSSTNGFADEKSSSGAGSESISALRWRRKAQTASGSLSSRGESELRISSSSFWLVLTPMSAVSSTFSISSTTEGSSSLRPAKSSPRRAMKPDERVRARPGASAAASLCFGSPARAGARGRG